MQENLSGFVSRLLLFLLSLFNAAEISFIHAEMYSSSDLYCE